MSERGHAKVTVTKVRPASGGCINEAALLEFSNGEPAFLKWNSNSPQGMFSAEALGLRELRLASSLTVPEVYHVHGMEGEIPAFLLMEDVTAAGDAQPPERGKSYHEELGAGLAEQHRKTAEYHGFDSDNFIGTTPQPNGKRSSWTEFFRDNRLQHMLTLLEAAGTIIGSHRMQFDGVLGTLDYHLAAGESEPPALLHGDLWSGNVLRDGKGRPALIDPAAYYGHREADLAMMDLFGGSSSRCRSAYEEAYPLLPGYSERRDIYNLYHILNHALLFGGGYLAQAISIAKRYS